MFEFIKPTDTGKILRHFFRFELPDDIDFYIPSRLRTFQNGLDHYVAMSLHKIHGHALQVTRLMKEYALIMERYNSCVFG